MSAEWAPLDERPGAGTPQCARRDDRQRRRFDLSLCRGKVMIYSRQGYGLGPRSCPRLVVLSVDGKSENICHPAASGFVRC